MDPPPSDGTLDAIYTAPIDCNLIILPGKKVLETNVTSSPSIRQDLQGEKIVNVENGKRKVPRATSSNALAGDRTQQLTKSVVLPQHLEEQPGWFDEKKSQRRKPQSSMNIEDSGLFEEDLHYKEPQDEFPGPYDPERVRMIYRNTCDHYNVVPSGRFLRSVNSGRVEAGYQGWGPLGTRAVAMSLLTSLKVTELHIPGNRLGPDGMRCMVNLIQDNEVIKVLDVSENDLGREGGQVLAKAIAENESIQEFRASGNKFDDVAGVFLGNAIQVNTQIRQLDFSRNLLSEEGVVAIAKGLEVNENISYLDLSYNRLRPKGIRGISKMLMKNVGLLNLNLSWNGIGTDGAKLIGEGLNPNETLACLGVNGCRLNLESLLSMLKKMPENTCLKSLEIVDNPLTNADMCFLIRYIQAIPDSSINFIDARSVMVSADFLKIVLETQSLKPGFVVTYRGQLSITDQSRNMMQTLDLTGGDPLEAIIKYSRMKNLRLVDIFARFDLDKSGTMTRQELIHGVATAGIPLTIKQMDRLVAKLDKDGNGEVDFAEFLDGYKKYMRNLHRQGIVARDMLKVDTGTYSEVGVDVKPSGVASSMDSEVGMKRRSSGERRRSSGGHGAGPNRIIPTASNVGQRVGGRESERRKSSGGQEAGPDRITPTANNVGSKKADIPGDESSCPLPPIPDEPQKYESSGELLQEGPGADLKPGGGLDTLEEETDIPEEKVQSI